MTGTPGKKRREQSRRTRRVAEYKAAIETLPVGACCGGCSHWRATPYDENKWHCSVESDSFGYAIRSSVDVCPKFKRSAILQLTNPSL